MAEGLSGTPWHKSVTGNRARVYLAPFSSIVYMKSFFDIGRAVENRQYIQGHT